jgi:orotate phosphoribosyltransferase
MSSEIPSADRAALLSLLATESFRLGDFLLASGKRSDYYIDCRTTTLHANGGRLAGIILFDDIRKNFPQVEAVGGLTMGADPIACNVATASAHYATAHPGAPLIHAFLVRKAEKTHGTGRKVEGFLRPGAQVVIVDDVCTTGGSTVTAIEAAREAGMVVAAVYCLVDREQGGRAAIEAAAAPAPFTALFTATDVRAEHIRLKPPVK